MAITRRRLLARAAQWGGTAAYSTMTALGLLAAHRTVAELAHRVAADTTPASASKTTHG